MNSTLLRATIPAMLVAMLTACGLNADDMRKTVDTTGAAPARDEFEAPKCRTSLRGALNEKERSQMQEVQAELYRMREETWDDRYRY